MTETTCAASARGRHTTTASGVRFHLFDPRPDEFVMADIAHHLARRPRFNGAVHGEGVTIGEHCVQGARYALVELAHEGLARDFLVHENGEAYLPDVPGPYKPAFPDYVAREDELQRRSRLAFGLPDAEHPWLRWLDLRQLVTERAHDAPHLLGDLGLDLDEYPPLPPAYAPRELHWRVVRAEFLRLARDLGLPERGA